MKLLRYILFPIVPVYYLVTWLRNVLYDLGIKKSKSYDFPLICVGNLSAGGTGKSPMVEYLIRLLKADYKLATLSRGYGRKTKGFQLGNETASAETLGDEPFQFYNKFSKEITVAVDENRQNGIANLLNLNPAPEVVLLDDAFQHRKVKAGLTILLSTYNNLYTKDWVLPTGNLREPKGGAKRAEIIVVTKCPKDISDTKKKEIIKAINPKSYQKVFFSTIDYNDEVVSKNEARPLKTLSKFTLVTGIANAKPLVNFLKEKGLDFNHLEFKDHHLFTTKDVDAFSKKELIVTTEKDFMRLKTFDSLKDSLFYLSIESKIDKSEAFNALVKTFTRS